MTTDPLDRLRELCFGLPGTEEVETWGHPTFRVRGKMFAACGRNDAGAASMTVKSDPATQHALVEQGAPYSVPAYVGRYGWVGIALDGPVDWGVVARLVTEAHRSVAPKRLRG